MARPAVTTAIARWLYYLMCTIYGCLELFCAGGVRRKTTPEFADVARVSSRYLRLAVMGTTQ